MTAPTLKLSDLVGPDADGWSDVAVFVRADGSDNPHVPPFVVKSFFHYAGDYLATIQHADGAQYERYADRYTVRRLGRGRLVPARIEMEGETAGADDRFESVCGALGLHPDTELSDVLETIQAVRGEARNYPALQIVIEGLRLKLAEVGVEGSPPPGGQGTIPMLLARAQDAEEQVRQLRHALGVSIRICEGLADQQAMPDDSYVPKLEQVRAALAATAPPPTEGAK